MGGEEDMLVSPGASPSPGVGGGGVAGFKPLLQKKTFARQES